MCGVEAKLVGALPPIPLISSEQLHCLRVGFQGALSGRRCPATVVKLGKHRISGQSGLRSGQACSRRSGLTVPLPTGRVQTDTLRLEGAGTQGRLSALCPAQGERFFLTATAAAP